MMKSGHRCLGLEASSVRAYSARNGEAGWSSLASVESLRWPTYQLWEGLNCLPVSCGRPEWSHSQPVKKGWNGLCSQLVQRPEWNGLCSQLMQRPGWNGLCSQLMQRPDVVDSPYCCWVVFCRQSWEQTSADSICMAGAAPFKKGLTVMSKSQFHTLYVYNTRQKSVQK